MPMKAHRYLFIFVISTVFLIPQYSYATDVTLSNARTQVYFSPKGGCTKAIVEAITKAKSEILVQAYSFTNRDIAKAMVDAHKRKVTIAVVLDRSNKTGKYSAASFTSHAGIPTYIDSQHVIAHNKIMIIDNEIVITGSFNFTNAAEDKNAENLLIIPSKQLARIYINNWFDHKAHSEPYRDR